QVTQAQTESSARPGRQAHTSILDQARHLRAAVVTGQAFRHWLGRQESKRGAGRAEGGGVPAAAVTGEGKKAAARPLISRSGGGQQRAAGASRFKSQEHPRVVIKDLDGLEPDRVQAFPPELMRKCFLHTDAPPGICPFTPREQASSQKWDREVLKVKKKDAHFVGAKVAARMPPAGSQKPRRGGWCECCEVQYIGTMSEHCASDRHTAAVAADPNFAALLAFESWAGAQDGSSVASGTAPGRTAAYPTHKAGIAGHDGTAVPPALPGPAAAATKGEGYAEGGGEALLPPVAESEGPRGSEAPRNDENSEALGTGSPPSGRRQGSAASSIRERRGEVPAATKEDSIVQGGAISPSGLRAATGGGGGCARTSRGSPRLRPKPDRPSGVALPSSEPGAPGECRSAPPTFTRGGCPPDGDWRRDHRRPGSPTADTPATSVASVPSSLTEYRSKQDSSSKSSVCPAESPAHDAQEPDKLSPLSASSSPTSTSPTQRRRSIGGSRGETASSVVGGASSSPLDAARRSPRAKRGGTGGVPEAPGTLRSPPSGRQRRGGDSPDTDPQQQRLNRPAPPREIETAPSPPPATTSEQEQTDKRKKKSRQKRALALLEASAGWAASIRGAAGPCRGDRAARIVATTTSGGRSSRGTTKASPLSSGESTAVQSRQGSKENSLPREDVGGGGGSPSTGRTNGPSRENEEGQQCGADRSGMAVEAGSNTEAREGCGGSAGVSARRRRAPPPPPPSSRCPPSPAEDAQGRERRPKRARLPPDNGYGYGEVENTAPSSGHTPPSGETSSGGTSSSRRSSARQAQGPSTASRMGLETAGAGRHSSPSSSERTRSTSRSLGSKFAENQTGSSNAASRARTKHAAVGAGSKIEPPTSKQARAEATRPCTRSELPRPTRRKCLSSPGSFLTEFS
ncbi:unnamed protein product, partial [Ectocarpus fasciculatus]